MNLDNLQLDERVIQGTGRIGVAVSGGRDSMVLLDVLIRHIDRERLVVLHLNHALRDAESEGDALFVERFCTENNLRFVTKTLHKNEIEAVVGQSLEMAARSARYSFFRDSIATHTLQALLMGHHGDDQVETMLMRLCAGTGVVGLASMERRRNIIKDVPLYRPLLEVSRSEIDAYAVEKKIEHREDSSNTDTRMLRNALRHDILPELRNINTGVARHIRDLGTEVGYLTQWVEPMLAELHQKICPEGILSTALFMQQEIWPRRELLRRWAIELGCARITRERIHALETFILRPSSLPIFELGEGVQVERFHGVVRQKHITTPIVEEIPINSAEQEQCFTFAGYSWNIRRLDKPYAGAQALPRQFFIETSSCKDLVLRTRREGDYINLKKGRKKIQRVFMDLKIDRDRRDVFALLVKKQQVILIPDYFRDAFMRPARGSDITSIEWSTNE